jgi:ketosteroid isomerase-like protein
MRTNTFSLVGIAVVGLGCAAPAPETTTDTAAEVTAIEAVRAQEVAAIQGGDTAMGYAADDIVLMPPGGPQVTGRAAAQTWFREFLAVMTPQSLTYGDAQVTVAGDWAIERYAGTLVMVPVGGGDPITEDVKGIHVYRKGADGAWKMAMDIWNGNTAPPGM